MVKLVASKNPTETEAWLDDLLNRQAIEHIGVPFQQDYITLEAQENGTRLGAIKARFAREWVFIELLALSPDARGKSIGRTLVEDVETRARAQGKTGIWLDTYSFQAPGFYEKMGFTRCGEIADYPPGHSRYFYAKRLDGQPLGKDSK